MAVEHYLLARPISLSESKTIVFHEDGVASDRTATIAAGDYWLNGIGAASSIMNVIASAMDSAPSASNTYTGTYQGKWDEGAYNCHASIGTSGTSVKILGTSTFDLTTIGFPQSDTTFLATLNSTLSSAATWTSSHPLEDDDALSRMAGVKVFRASQRQTHTFQVADSEQRWAIGFQMLEQTRVLQRAAEDASDDWRALEKWWDSARKAEQIRIYATTEADTTKLTTLVAGDEYGDGWTLIGDSLENFEPVNDYPWYSAALSFAEYAA